ncbi:SAYSvFN domain-containing protein 1 [Tribolium madens]|uniref:SAYSvFN domain-containing protein 1 n=1 Tax=Tribolium madens TaxID=41895 RepID=UPI001CF76785|nr:SAYSvFN domain-containing protein 1 [Tribolium madens]XP_044264087.1 SAYSvFN domain-containing protein 1 [Tribolium madens]
MDPMEKKLAEYRARKAREGKINEIKAKTKSFFSDFWKKRPKTREPKPTEKEVLVPHSPPEDEYPEDASSACSDDESINCFSYVDLFYYLLWFGLWIVLYVIFIEFQFGTVFFIVSAIVFMYVNTRTGPKKVGEVSAYSVFNKNCESINGTLKAEQFEREIRYGPAVVH